MAEHITHQSSKARKTTSREPSSPGGKDACHLLRLLRDQEFNTREQLAEATGLSRRGLAKSLSFLKSRGLIQLSDHRSVKRDRLSRIPQINASYGHVIAIDIGGSNLRVAIADITGSVLAKWTASTKSTSSPEMVVKQVRSGVNQLLQQTKVRRSSLLAAAAGAPGVTNRTAGIVFATSYLKGWRDVPLARLLEAELNIPAVVENDVKAAAIGENWIGAARGVRDFVFLAIGTGIAAGIFVNGQLVHGPNWVAGEVGYMLVPGAPDGPAKLGAPGSLEGTIGGEGIRQQWLASCDHKSARNGQDLTATGIFYHALAGNLHARNVLERTARILAYAVYNISSVLNSSLFVLGGGVGTNGLLITATRRILEPYTQPARPKLITSSLGEDAQLIGAVRLALDCAESQIAARLVNAKS